VAKLLVHRHFQGQPSFLPGNEPDIGLGTGWLLAPAKVTVKMASTVPELPSVTLTSLILKAGVASSLRIVPEP